MRYLNQPVIDKINYVLTKHLNLVQEVQDMIDQHVFQKSLKTDEMFVEMEAYFTLHNSWLINDLTELISTNPHEAIEVLKDMYNQAINENIVPAAYNFFVNNFPLEFGKGYIKSLGQGYNHLSDTPSIYFTNIPDSYIPESFEVDEDNNQPVIFDLAEQVDMITTNLDQPIEDFPDKQELISEYAYMCLYIDSIKSQSDSEC